MGVFFNTTRDSYGKNGDNMGFFAPVTPVFGGPFSISGDA